MIVSRLTGPKMREPKMIVTKMIVTKMIVPKIGCGVMVALLNLPFAFGQAPEISKLESVKKEYLTAVKPIYEKKCFNCHSSKTVFPWYHSLPMVKQMLDRNVAEAKEAIDFTNDFPFSGKKAKDYAAMVNCLNDETMPPGLYLAGNPDAKLTDDEKKILRDWVEKAKQVSP